MLVHRMARDNFDGIRLLAALAVFFSHQVKLTGRGALEVSNYHDLGKMGVLVFFVMSGFLVVQSWERDPHLWRFLARRFLRIWPGLVVVVLLTVFVLGPIMTTLPVRDYFQAPQTFHYLSHIFLVIQERLPGVFVGQTIERVNGPLWTIPIEVGWYVALAVMGAIGVLRYRYTMLLALLACAVYVFGIYDVENQEVAPFWELEFGLFFLYGACLHYFRRAWQPHPWLAASAVTSLAMLAGVRGHEYIAILIALPYFVILIALASTPFLRDAGRWGDLSYGIYIYSFPVQQSIVALLKNSLGLLGGAVIALAGTLLLAWMSWHFVEAPALSLKRLLHSKNKSRKVSGTAQGKVV